MKDDQLMDDFKWETPPFPTSQPPARKGASFAKKRAPLIVATCLASALVGGAIGGGVAATVTAQSAPTTVVSSPAAVTTTSDKSVISGSAVNPDSLSSVIAASMPSVVTVSAVTDQTAGTGSGVVLNDQGYIVTNAHVATLAGQSLNAVLNVQTSEGDSVDATLVGYDPTADLAVLKVDPSTPGLKPIVFANSDGVALGDETIAIGSPLGLTGTVTTGIVSALNRPITVASSEVTSSDSSSQQGNQNGVSISAIQTDAAINPGNSGGALLNAEGQLIGINVAIANAGGNSSGAEQGNIGVGFAIPADYVNRVVNEIIKDGKATHGYFGSGVGTDTENDSVFTTGAILKNIESDGPAAKAGLQDGDVVTKFNDVPVETAGQLIAMVRQSDPGSTVTITYEHNGDTKTADVTLGQAS